MSLNIVIPAHNEESRIEDTVKRYLEFFRTRIDFNITIVVNASKDRTLEIVNKLKSKNKELIVLDFTKGGKGYAIKEGFKEALKKDYDLIGFVDADMATSPEAFYDLVLNIKNNDGIIASRWKKGAVIKVPQTALRKVLSRGFNFIVKVVLLLPYSDTQCGAKLFKKEAVRKVINKLELTQWAFDVDLLYKMRKSGAIIKEIPTVWEEKKDSKLNVTKVPFQMFLGVVRIRLLNSPLRKAVKLYDKLPERFKIHEI